MKFFLLCAAFITTPLMLVSIPPNIQQNTSTIATNQSIRVIDGDTFEYQSEKIRLYCIDAPESKQKYGLESKINLTHLTSDKRTNSNVQINRKNKDLYGRTIAEVLIDNKNINKEQIQKGLAVVYKDYCTDPSYIDLEKDAQSAKVGLWSSTDICLPSNYRKKLCS